MRKLIFVGVAILALAGCKQEPAGNAAQPAATANEAAPAAAATEGAVAVKPELQLSPYGLLSVDPATKKVTPFAFGAPRADVDAAVTAAVGKSTAEGTSPECPAGPVATADYPGGLSLVFQEGKFVGWDAGRNPKGFATQAGIRIGSTRAELDKAYDPQVGESTLGTEFSVGRMGGTLTSTAADAKIENLWGGTICIYR